MTLELIRMYLASETVTPEQADHYIAVITQIERQRIIKVLDDVVAKWDFQTEGEPRGQSHYWLRLVTDALKYQIKGEK